MRAVCVDALNPAGNPTPKQIRALGANGIRVEMRDDQLFYNYSTSFLIEAARYGTRHKVAYLLGPSTENWHKILLSSFPPSVIIIGNEPDGKGDSSWQMTPAQYIDLWNNTTPTIKNIMPQVSLCAAGMVNGPEYLRECWPHLNIKPNLVNKHYPNNAGELQAFSGEFSRPVCCFEWCWRTATYKEMYDWCNMLSVCTAHSSYFCWSDDMVDGMGLITKRMNRTASYERYRAALRAIKEPQ